jgi:hypothetical protein
VNLCALVLAAGRGKRLRPLTDLRPKPLCPVNNEVLLDRVLSQVSALVPDSADVAVNAHHLHDQIEAHVAGRGIHVSVEQPQALGTAGAVGALRAWIDGRPLLVANGDAWRSGSLGELLDGWDGERVRLLTVRDPERSDFGDLRYAGACLLPPPVTALLPATPAGLYEVCWAGEHAAGLLDLLRTGQGFVDCGPPSEYLRANLLASGGASVVGAGAVVTGELVRAVVWPGGRVAAGERLVEAIRVGADLTVPAPQHPRPAAPGD